jgi:SAM-dependent methyltransferase
VPDDPRTLDALLEDRGGDWWSAFFTDRAKDSANPCPFPAGSYDLVYDSGCFHHLPPHRRKDYVDLVNRALRPGGSYGLACFRPEGGSGYTDEQVYERASLGGGLGYSEDGLRALWDHAPFRVRELRQMRKTDGRDQCFGQRSLWVLLASKHR